jgi:hypothetical protein
MQTNEQQQGCSGSGNGEASGNAVASGEVGNGSFGEAPLQLGDRVRIDDLNGFAECRSQGLFVGNTGTVTAVYQDAVDVRTDSAAHPTDESGFGWCFNVQALARIGSAK